MKRNQLRASLEEFDPTVPQEKPVPITGERIAEYEQEKSFVFKGPLAEVMTQALQVAYAKKDPVEDALADNDSQVPALESAAQDQQLLEQMLERIVPDDAQDASNVTIVYGFPNNSVTSGDVTDITESFQAAKDESEDGSIADDFAIVIDGTEFSEDGKSSVNTTKTVDLTAALEAIAISFGVPVYRSLADVMRQHSK